MGDYLALAQARLAAAESSKDIEVAKVLALLAVAEAYTNAAPCAGCKP